MPSKFRQLLSKEVVVFQSHPECLTMLPRESWDEVVEQKLSDIGLTSFTKQDFARFVRASAEDCKVDGNGRLVLNQRLREYAGLKEEVCIIGNGRWVEIWDRERWESKRMSAAGPDFFQRFQDILP